MSDTKTIQGIVLRENDVQSSEFISEMEARYLPAIEKVSNQLKELGIQPSLELISAAIQGNFETVERAYRPIIDADSAKFSSPAMRASIETMFIDNMSNLRNLVLDLFSNSIGNQYAGGICVPTLKELAVLRDRWGNVSMADVFLIEFVQLDERHTPFIPQESKEQIADLFREYASPDQMSIYKNQTKAAMALSDLANALVAGGINVDLELVPQLFFRRFFIVQKTDAGEYKLTPNIQGSLSHKF